MGKSLERMKERRLIPREMSRKAGQKERGTS
jgi:hypothetical protein